MARSSSSASDRAPDRTAAGRRRGRRVVVVVLAVVSLLVVAYLVRSGDVRSARATAEDYLAAVDSGDASGAWLLTESADEARGCTALTSDAVYATLRARPAGASLTTVEVRDRTEKDGSTSRVADVELVYTPAPGDDEVDGRLELVEVDGGWRVVDGVGLGASALPVVLDGPGALEVEGECSVAAGAEGTLEVLPGTYEVGYADPDGVGTAAPQTVTAPGGAPVTVLPEPTPDRVSEVTQEVTSWVLECAGSGFTVTVCPDENREVTTRFDVDAVDPVEIFEVVVVGRAATLADPGGWLYSIPSGAPVSFDGRIRPGVCQPESDACRAGMSTSDVTFVDYSGSVRVDDGRVVLTRD